MKHTQLKTQHSTGLATKPHHRVLAVCKHSSIRYACQVSCQCDRKDALGNLSHASTSADPDRWPNSHGVDRRSALAMGAALLGGPTRALCGLPAQANEAPTPPNQKLPKAYVEVVQRVIKSLRESIEAEQKDGKETEVRRKADPAKEALQVFVKRWRDDPKVQQHPSHESIKGVLLELSSFYQTAGPRARMPADVQERLLGLLASAESSLAATPGAKQSSKEKDTTSKSGSTLSLFDEKSELEELLPKVRD